MDYKSTRNSINTRNKKDVDGVKKSVKEKFYILFKKLNINKKYIPKLNNNLRNMRILIDTLQVDDLLNSRARLNYGRVEWLDHDLQQTRCRIVGRRDLKAGKGERRFVGDVERETAEISFVLALRHNPNGRVIDEHLVVAEQELHVLIGDAGDGRESGCGRLMMVGGSWRNHVECG